MSSNLPPGCNSDDGGIDHALEEALERLCDKVKSVQMAMALEDLIPAVEKINERAVCEGIFELMDSEDMV